MYCSLNSRNKFSVCIFLTYSSSPLGWDTLQPAMLLGTQIRSGVSWLLWQLVEAVWHGCQRSQANVFRSWDQQSLSLRRPSSQALTLFGGSLFLGECWWGSRHFWNHQVCVGYSPAPVSHNKKGLVPYSCICEVLDNHWNIISNPCRGMVKPYGYIAYTH